MPAQAKKSGAAQARSQPTSSFPQNVAAAAKTVRALGPVQATNVAQSAPQASPSPVAVLIQADGQNRSIGDPGPAPTVNRKKQKRREKEAAKRAVEQDMHIGYSAPGQYTQNGHTQYSHSSRGPPKGYFTEEPDYVDPDFADEVVDEDDAFYNSVETPDFMQDPPMHNGYQHTSQPASGALPSKKKNKNKTGGSLANVSQSQISSHLRALSGNPAAPSGSQLPPPPPLSNAALRSVHKISRDRIWNTSTQAERANIKQFWLELGEEERRSLVKVEKEAVLRKMKEQQKHSCSCTVCGRKRTAIEEELEVLYDAYYEELEQFANRNTAPPLMGPPRTYSQLRGPPHPMAGQYPSRGRVHEIGEDDEELEEDDEYDEDEEPYSDEEIEEQPPRGPPDFFTFGNSLTVKDGILTVADDLLKNDGKHFIDMMEQLAERRMQREEETHYPSAALSHQNVHQGHNHPPLDEDDDYDDEEEDEDYDSQDEEDYEGDEMDAMTEEQRMEEGRRMFQIFAARMFEQRVLTAYREKVARERQLRLIEELEEEDRLDTQREAKKAKEAAKKKEKKKAQKQAKEEEKAKKEAEKVAHEAAARAVEEQKLEEQRQRKEEQRKKREAEKRAAEEERTRKEAEKLRKAQEERERQAETERKQREAKEHERRKREEGRRKEREEKEARDKEVRERKAREETERKGREEQLRKEKEATAKAEKESRDRVRQEQGPRRQPVALPPGLHPPHHPSSLQSPHFQVATPIIPKAATPNRPRQASQQGPQSHSSSPRSQQANTDTSHSSASPASIAVPQTPGLATGPPKGHGQPPVLHHPQPSAPLSPLNHQGRGAHPPFNFNGMAGLGMSGPPSSGLGMMPGIIPSMPMYQGPPTGGQHRNFGPPNGLPFPPGINHPRPFPPGPHMPFHSQAPMPVPISAPQNQPPKPQGHSRQQSTSHLDAPPSLPLSSRFSHTTTSRPAPIGRPPSTTPEKPKDKRRSTDQDVENLATQLGSKALLDDSDIPLSSSSESTTMAASHGAPGSGRSPFVGFPEPKHDNFALGGPSWNGFSPAVSGTGNWGVPGAAGKQGSGWPASTSQPSNNAFGFIGGGLHSMARPHAPRPVAIRLMLTQACIQLSSTPGYASDGFHPIQAVLRQVEQLKPPNEPPISLNEMLEICDTEGNPQNGGGSFDVRHDTSRGQIVKFDVGGGAGGRGVVGDIGSPVVGQTHMQPANLGGIGQAIGAPGRGL